MLYLLLSVLSNVGILMVFRLAGRNHIHVLSMVCINYLVASLLGSVVFVQNGGVLEQTDFKFYLVAVIIGVAFMLMFLLVQKTINNSGIAITSAVAKLSVVIPIIVSLIIDPFDAPSFKKTVGFVTMLISLVLIMYVPGKEGGKRLAMLLPLVLFLGMGAVDATVKVSQQFVVGESRVPLFTLTVFCVSAISGLTLLLIKREHRKLFLLKPVVFGVVLGACNYGSLFFIVKALNLNLSGANFLDSSRIFMFNNVAIILISVVVGIVFFKEKLTLSNYLGLLLSIAGFYLLV